MKAIIVTQTQECLIDTVPLPVPAEGQVLIKTICSPIHKLDIHKFRGTFGIFSGTPGFEGAGTVVKAGSGFKTQKLKGKNVCFFKNSSNSGAWAEYVLCESSDCCIINEEFGFIKGSTMMLMPLTMIMIGKIIKRKKFTCVINTLSSSTLGKMIVRWCAHKDVTCINLAKNELKVRELIEIGAKYVINCAAEGFKKEFFNICDKLKPAACFDGLGGELGALAFSYLKERGFFYMFDCLDHSGVLQMLGKDLVHRRKTVKGLWMPGWYSGLNERKKQKYFKKIQKRQHIFRSDNIIVSPVIDVLPFLNDYFQTLPENKTILDFSEFSQATSALLSPLASPRTTGIEQFPLVESESEESEDLTELVESYKDAEVISFISTLPYMENLPDDSKLFMLSDSSIFFGRLKDKRPEGFCNIFYPNGNVYQGGFQMLQRKGKGRMIFACLDWFEGSWKDDIPAGSGIFHFNDGRVIQGNFLNFDVIGSGIEILKNGESYEGGFIDRKRNGKGTLVTKDWKYEGKFKAGEIFGYGVVKFHDGREFVGEFNGNVGVGLLKYTDFTYFEGKIVQFKEEGEGEIVNKEGVRRKGVWEMGKLKHWIDEGESFTSIREKDDEVFEDLGGKQVEIASSDEDINFMVIK
jgi:NADPH:quinone reductase-like Zn-dependent oxidoreductase